MRRHPTGKDFIGDAPLPAENHLKIVVIDPRIDVNGLAPMLKKFASQISPTIDFIYERVLKNVWFRFVVTIVVFLTLVVFLSRRHGLVPALGPLLDPYHGIWVRQGSPFEGKGERKTLNIEGLKASVEISVDPDGIKHIFAQNDEDLYFAEGYVVASDRLWQMEFITRVAAGRLSELIGAKGLDLDRFFNRLGVPQAAKESSEFMLQDPMTSLALTNYARGVNTYIRSLSPARLPMEYKLLAHQPEEWTPLKSALLLKFMAWDLSGFSHDVPLTRSRGRLSQTEFDDLFPLKLPIPEPIIPVGTKWNIKNHDPEAPTEMFQPRLDAALDLPMPDPSNGSNNWAVSGKKSTTGLPILSNDVHLGYSLPALWYEIQLSSPQQNVYGATLPGAPGVILGFNSKVAWAVTNGGTDVMDWFQLRFRDEREQEYLYDGTWRPVISREVQINVRDQKPVTVLLRSTHLGPIVTDDKATEKNAPFSALSAKGLAMRWQALSASNELRSFLLLNRATKTDDCRSALEQYQTPDQNFLCADQKDNIALWHTGRYPLRWLGQGRLIGDGSNAQYDWQGWIPPDENPNAKNPDRGFLSSANQSPTDATYPHYLGWPFEAPFRGMRINEILRAKAKFSPDDIIAMQGDTLAVSARRFLPPLLKAMDGGSLDQTAQQALETLKKWDYRFEEESVGAALYHAWFHAFEARLWAPHFPNDKEFMHPPLVRTLQLVETEPQSKWFDDPETKEREGLREVARLSFASALTEVREKLSSGDPASWTWAKYHPVTFAHQGRLPGLGDSGLSTRGMEHSIFANTGTHGPVWKMVVALGPKPRAWGIYPGGQSGDPASPHYDNFLLPWSKNELKPLVYLTTPDDVLTEKNHEAWSHWQLNSAPSTSAKGGH